jgi:hypothetical protein
MALDMHMTHQQTEHVTVAEAVSNAARLLRHAELETNLATVERLDSLADSWLNMAALLSQCDTIT